jgi:alkaline phosphatase
MDDMPASGWSRTWNAAGEVTDSAAGATAIATGHKTANGMVSMDLQLNELPTILEAAQARGKAVGLITTTQLTDATPAAFAAHASSRGLSDEIAEQMTNADVDLMFGGGEDKFLPASETGCYSSGGDRQDTRNVITEAQALGYTYLCQPSSVQQLEPATATPVLGLFADGLMLRPPAPSLELMTGKAIDILSRDPDGFFLMVEGGLIDKAGHGHDARNAIQDVLELDNAVAVAKEFAATVPDTLIIVAADHDTGGMDVLPLGSGASDVA